MLNKLEKFSLPEVEKKVLDFWKTNHVFEKTEVYKVLDKMAKVGLIKKNKAGRFKSRLARKLNKKG